MILGGGYYVTEAGLAGNCRASDQDELSVFKCVGMGECHRVAPCCIPAVYLLMMPPLITVQVVATLSVKVHEHSQLLPLAFVPKFGEPMFVSQGTFGWASAWSGLRLGQP
jgi:hypothetical protein